MRERKNVRLISTEKEEGKKKGRERKGETSTKKEIQWNRRKKEENHKGDRNREQRGSQTRRGRISSRILG
jgi:hypothetical protein